MIAIALKKTGLELWDNGFVAFCINLLVLGLLLALVLMIGGFFGDPRYQAFALTLLAVISFLIVVGAGYLFSLAVTQSGFDQKVLSHIIRSTGIALIVFLPVCLWLSLVTAFFPSISPVSSTLHVALSLVGMWLTVICLQTIICTLSAIAAGGRSTLSALSTAARFALYFPVQGMILTVFSIALTLLTLGLFPGFVGLTRLFQNLADLVEHAPSQDQPTHLQKYLASQNNALANRTAKTVLFPWRMR